MEIEAPSGRPTPSPKEDRMSLLVAKVKAEWGERMARYAAEKAAREKGLPEEDSGEEDDYYAVEASKFRDTWNSHYSRYSGCFEDSSELFIITQIALVPRCRSWLPVLCRSWHRLFLLFL
jgi:hypothetical protein